MTVFKYNKGKLVEQPTMEKPADNEHWVATTWIAANKQYEEHLSSLRTYIAEGFAEDELVEEKDFILDWQIFIGEWQSCTELQYEDWNFGKTRIIARKVTKEEGEKPDQYQIACDDVLKEVRRAKIMFKEKFVNQHEGYAVILEELDELWDEVKKNQRDYVLSLQRKEAIQCAAMCIRFIAELTPNNLT